MPSQDVVVQLNRELAGTKVLSVYLNAQETDPAERRAWRIRLNGLLKGVDERLTDEPAEERKAARAAAELISQELERYQGMLPGHGWVGFATAERLWHAESSPAPMPDLVRWEDGAHVAPYIRALKQARPVTAVLADRRHARLFRYLHGELTEEAVLRSDTGLVDGPGAGGSNRPSTHSGARGETRSDAANRSEEAATQRLLRDVLDALSGPVNEGHSIVVAGSSEVAVALIRAIPERAEERTIDLAGIGMDATHAELKEAIEAAASTLSIRLQRGLVEEVLEATRSAGRACVGREPTERALEAGAVDMLIISRAFARAEPEAAESLVDRAFGQGAAVEEIAEEAANELDREGGVGARLRFNS